MADDRAFDVTDLSAVPETDASASGTPTPCNQTAPGEHAARVRRRPAGATDAEARELADMDSRLRALAGIVGRHPERSEDLAEYDRISDQRNQRLADIRRCTTSPGSVRLVSRIQPTGHLDGHEELLSAKARRVREIAERHRKITSGAVLNFRPAGEGQEHLHPDYGAVSQYLADEAALHLDVERLHQALNRDSRLPVAGPCLEDARIARPLRDNADARLMISSLCGQHFALDRASQVAGDDWADLSTVQRVWAVNHLVFDMLASAPERAGRVRFSDLVAAANGDPAAWASLRASVTSSASDEEVRPVADLDRRLTEVRAVIGAEIAAVPADVLNPGSTPGQDEHGRLSLERDRLRAEVRVAPPLREPTPNELGDLSAECDAWRAMDHGQREIKVLEIFDIVDRGAREPHLAARSDLPHLTDQALLYGNVAAYRKLLCLSRGLDPGEGSATSATATSGHYGEPRTRVVVPEHDPKLTPMVPNFPADYAEAYRRLCEELDRRPDQTEVALELKLPLSTFKRYLRNCRKTARLSWPPM